MNGDMAEPEQTDALEEQLDLPEGVPPLRSFYLYLTDGCNLRCRHCWISPAYVKGEPSPGDYLDFDRLREAVTAAEPMGLVNAKLTGGEPMLHPDFIRIVDYLSDRNISMTMETNGTLIDPDLARHLKEQTKIWHIAVSLDSPRPAYHDWFRGVEGAFDKAVRGIECLAAAGFKPQVIMCPHHGNLDEIDAMVQMAMDLGAGSVKFNPVGSVGRGTDMRQKGGLLDFDEMMRLIHYINQDLQPRIPIPLSIMVPPALLSISELLCVGGFCGTCNVLNILGILGNGELALCGIGRTIPELCFGRLGEDDLKSVWIHHPVLNELRKGMAGQFPGICGDCIHAPGCLMHCVAQNYVENGELLSPSPICIEADKRGLFPGSRRRSLVENNSPGEALGNDTRNM